MLIMILCTTFTLQNNNVPGGSQEAGVLHKSFLLDSIPERDTDSKIITAGLV